MQNISFAQQYRQRLRMAACTVALLALCMVFTPSTALAKSYSMPSVDIDARVDASGTLHVAEDRVFDFSGSFSCVWWELGPLPQGGSLAIEDVRMATGASDSFTSSEFTPVSEVPFETRWRDAGGPGKDAWSFDAAKDSVYVFFSAEDETLVVHLEYSVSQAVNAHADGAELYWKFVGSGWAEDSKNVSCTIALPAPNAATATPGETVYVWGHGPANGHAEFNDTGTQATFTLNRVPSGEFAEARVVFPLAWLDSSVSIGPAALDSILSEEEGFASEANRGRLKSLLFSGLLGLGALVSVLWSGIMFLRHGREHKPTFTDDYWRDVPHKGIHPATIGRLMRWNRESNDDLVTTIMHLATLGALKINKGTYEEEGLLTSKTVEDYYITRVPSVEETLTNPIDKQAMKLLFDTIAKGPSMWLDEIRIWGKDHPEKFRSKLSAWQSCVTKDVAAQDYFDVQGSHVQTIMAGIATALFVAAFFLVWLTENLLPAIIFIPAAAIVVAFAVFAPRRTQAGADDYARALGLKKWLQDFTLLDERVTTDVKVWGEFMVYAHLFGIAEKVMAELRKTMPQVFIAEDAIATSNDGYVPWYSWYTDRGVGHTLTGSFPSAFETVLENTLSTVSEILADTVSADGSGGGFSGGGGGGFGGGGGGAR